jgi:hypothetical protein
VRPWTPRASPRDYQSEHELASSPDATARYDPRQLPSLVATLTAAARGLEADLANA